MASTYPHSDDGQPAMENDQTTQVAEFEADARDAVSKQDAEWTGPRCEKCSAPIKSDVVAVCRNCGWYGSLGTYVELDPQWEEEPDEDQQPVATPQLSHVQVWLDLMPRWAWILIASVMTVVLESAVARLVTPAGSQFRTIWSLAQLAIGTLTFIGFHVFNFMTVAADDAEMGVLDLILKPVRTWLRTLRGLPARLWIVNAAACGLTAAVMSIVLIGGIPYYVLWDWGFKQPPKPNLMGAVMSQIQKAEDKRGADNLEDAVADFAASQDAEAEQPKPKPAPPKPRERADCVIIGYRLDGNGRISTLLLAAAKGTKLAYAGYVSPELTDEEMADLVSKLNRVKTTRPFLPVHTTAVWVDPKFTCRITFKKRAKSGQFSDIKWDSLLGELHMP